MISSKMNLQSSNTSKDSEGRDLLQSWSSSNKKKRVSFSEFSTFSTYRCCWTYRTNDMSYSSADYNVFRFKASLDAQNIKVLILSNILDAASNFHAGCVILHLLQKKLLSVEQLIGIEYLVSECPGSNTCRRDHMALVLKVQQDMKEKYEEDVDMKLAQTAIWSSSKHTKLAWCKAMLSSI
jgi:hypothetical protein